MIVRLALALLLVGAPAWAANVTLTWQDNSPQPGSPAEEQGFVIERWAGGALPCGPGPYQEVGRVGMNVTTYTDAAVTAGVIYCYRVAAYNAAGLSAYSNFAGALVPLALPATPSGLGVSVGP